MYSANAKITPHLLRPFWKFRSARLTSSDVARAPTADELQRRYLPAVLNYVAARVGRGDTAEAEDITAEVFAAAFTFLHRCPELEGSAPSISEHDPARAWLLGIARRKTCDSYRRRARRPQDTLTERYPAPSEQSPESQVLAEEAARTLYEILSTLPDEQREALCLRYIDELSLGDMGRLLGKSPNAVAQLLHRARQSMRVRGAAYFKPSLDTTKERK